MAEFVLEDPTRVPDTRQTWLNQALSSILYDPRDVVFLHLYLKAAAVMGAFCTLFFWRFQWWYVIPYAVAFYLVAPPVILMLHCTMHRPFIKRRRWLTRFIPLSLSFLVGIPCGYMEHHVGMHHPENNLPDDLSSTMAFQRDRFTHFLRYFGRFFFGIYLELPLYFVRKKRTRLAWRAMPMEFVHLAVMGAALALNWRAALCCLVVPFVLVRFMMMAGNWGQHAFIDPAAPGDSVRNSINCINSRYNTIAFNDGYHIVHHEKPALHWTEMPAFFDQHRVRYARSGAIVFRSLDFFLISALLWMKRYDVLARHLVTLEGAEPPLEERIAFLKSRTRAIPS